MLYPGHRCQPFALNYFSWHFDSLSERQSFDACDMDISKNGRGMVFDSAMSEFKYVVDQSKIDYGQIDGQSRRGNRSLETF